MYVHIIYIMYIVCIYRLTIGICPTFFVEFFLFCFIILFVTFGVTFVLQTSALLDTFFLCFFRRFDSFNLTRSSSGIAFFFFFLLFISSVVLTSLPMWVCLRFFTEKVLASCSTTFSRPVSKASRLNTSARQK